MRAAFESWFTSLEAVATDADASRFDRQPHAPRMLVAKWEQSNRAYSSVDW